MDKIYLIRVCLSQVLDGVVWSIVLERQDRAHMPYTGCLRRQSLHLRLRFIQPTLPMCDPAPNSTREEWHHWKVTKHWSALGFLTRPWEALFKPESWFSQIWGSPMACGSSWSSPFDAGGNERNNKHGQKDATVLRMPCAPNRLILQPLG